MREQDRTDTRGLVVAVAAVVVISVVGLAAIGLYVLRQGGADRDAATPAVSPPHAASHPDSAAPPPPAAPAPAATGPGAESGTIRTVLTDKRYASVEVKGAHGWKINDEVELTDASGRLLTTGTVKAVLAQRNAVHVKYEPPADASRPIATDDVVRRTGRTVPDEPKRP